MEGTKCLSFALSTAYVCERNMYGHVLHAACNLFTLITSTMKKQIYSHDGDIAFEHREPESKHIRIVNATSSLLQYLHAPFSRLIAF